MPSQRTPAELPEPQSLEAEWRSLVCTVDGALEPHHTYSAGEVLEEARNLAQAAFELGVGVHPDCSAARGCPHTAEPRRARIAALGEGDGD